MEKEFLEVIHDYQKIIYKICRVYRNSKEDQEDLFQDIVYQLWKSYPSFKRESCVISASRLRLFFSSRRPAHMTRGACREGKHPN